MTPKPEMWMKLESKTGIPCKACEEANRRIKGDKVMKYKTSDGVLICPHCDAAQL